MLFVVVGDGVTFGGFTKKNWFVVANSRLMMKVVYHKISILQIHNTRTEQKISKFKQKYGFRCQSSSSVVVSSSLSSEKQPANVQFIMMAKHRLALLLVRHVQCFTLRLVCLCFPGDHYTHLEYIWRWWKQKSFCTIGIASTHWIMNGYYYYHYYCQNKIIIIILTSTIDQDPMIFFLQLMTIIFFDSSL